jgi:DNA polymerase-3 subunit delta'
MSSLAPWIQRQLTHLLRQQGHAWLIQGPSGLGQYELGLALASAWLCEHPTPEGACGTCKSCHAISVRTHPDLCLLMPETLMLDLDWPLDEKTQKDLDDKKRKPSREIRVDAARDMVGFSQTTRSGGQGKVVLIHPADRMNTITANTLLKTLEEPPGDTRFVLTSEAAHLLLPTVRSRCQTHTLQWPQASEAQTWLAASGLDPAQASVLLRASGGRPNDVLRMAHDDGIQATQWAAWPKALQRGDAGILSQVPPAIALSMLQKLCHDVLALRVGATPRFFERQDLPEGGTVRSLTAWSRSLAKEARTAEHPFNAGLMLESLVSQAQKALRLPR